MLQNAQMNVRPNVGALILLALAVILLIVVIAVVAGAVRTSSRQKQPSSSASHKDKFSQPMPLETWPAGSLAGSLAGGEGGLVEGRGRAGMHVSSHDPAVATSVKSPINNLATGAAGERENEHAGGLWRWFTSWRGGNGTAGQSSIVDEVYADNNATTPMFREVIDVMVRAYGEYYANPSSIHSAGKRSAEALENSREIIAALIGAKPEEIYFTSGATESNNLAIRGVMRVALSPAFCAVLSGEEPDLETEKKDKKKGGSMSKKERKQPEDETKEKIRLAARDDRQRRKEGNIRHKIVTTPIEHASVYETAASIDPDVEVLHVNVDRKGKIDVAHFASLVSDPEVALACVIMGNNEIGTVQDVAHLSKICRKQGVHFHCDMTQVFGKYAVDLEVLKPDSATMSAHKFHGPKGVGALYVRQGAWIDNTCMTGGSQEGAMRAGTENVAGVCGMAAALQQCDSLIALGRDKEVRQMRDRIRRTLLSGIPGLVINGDRDAGLFNTLSVCIPDINSRQLIPLLDSARVYVNTGCACSKGQGSTTLRALGLTDKYVNGSLRISLSYLTTEQQCERLCAAMFKALQVLKNNQQFLK